MNWSPNYRMETAMLSRVYCRLMVHYFDWASLVPELAEFSEADRANLFNGLPEASRNNFNLLQQNLIVKRAIRCIWMLSTFRSAVLNCEGIATSCQMHFPYGAAEQAKLEPEWVDHLGELGPFLEIYELFPRPKVPGVVRRKREFGLHRVGVALPPAGRVRGRVLAAARALPVHARFTIPLFFHYFFLNISSQSVCRLSPDGRQRVLSIQSKYLNALGDLVRRRDGSGSGAGGPMLRMSRLMMFLATCEASSRKHFCTPISSILLQQVAQLDDNAFSMLNVFNLAGMRGMLTYDIHLADQREREAMAATAGGSGEGPVRQ
jgi:hypothetical protein